MKNTNKNSKKHSSLNNAFNSSVMEDVKEGVEKFIQNAVNICWCGNQNDHQHDNMTKDIVNKLSHNIKNSFEQNMELGQEILKCKTLTDFIEFQKKNFEINYKNTTKTYSELFHDMQNFATEGLKTMNFYTNKKHKPL